MLFCDQPGLHQPLAYVKHVAPIIGGFYIDRDFLSQELEHDKGFPYKVFKKMFKPRYGLSSCTRAFFEIFDQYQISTQKQVSNTLHILKTT